MIDKLLRLNTNSHLIFKWYDKVKYNLGANLWIFVFCNLFSFCFNDSVYQSEKLFKYVGFVDYSEDVISHEQLMKLIEENYQRIPKCNYGVAIVKTPETAANIGLSILSSKFGEEFVDAQKPFRVYLLNGKVWMLQGNVADNKGSVILIQKFDGTILSIKK